MSPLPLPELARQMAAFNRRVADSVAAAVRRVERLQEKMEPAEALKKTATRSAREAIRHTLSHAPDVQAVWQTALEVGKEGLAGEEFKTMLQDVQNVVESWLILAEKTRTLWRFADRAGAGPNQLEELTQAEAAVREVKNGIRIPPPGPAILSVAGRPNQPKAFQPLGSNARRASPFWDDTCGFCKGWGPGYDHAPYPVRYLHLMRLVRESRIVFDRGRDMQRGDRRVSRSAGLLVNEPGTWGRYLGRLLWPALESCLHFHNLFGPPRRSGLGNRSDERGSRSRRKINRFGSIRSLKQTQPPC